MRYDIHARRQKGAVLIITLLFLVILTMLGVTAMTSTTFEERMAGATRDTAIAFQAAEAALRDARRDINGLAAQGSFNSGRLASMHESAFGRPANASDVGKCVDGRCTPRWYTTSIGSSLPAIPDVNFDTDKTKYVEYGTYTGADPILGKQSLSHEPRYIIELFCLQTQEASIEGQASMCKFYRLTAKGYGLNPNSQATVQEVFLKL